MDGTDGIKKLADRLHNHHPKDKPKKATRTVSVTYKVYTLLFAYCHRKKLNIGDVISDLMQMLLDELSNNGELIMDDQTLADEYEKQRVEREEAKNKFKHSIEIAPTEKTDLDKEPTPKADDPLKKAS